MKKFKNIITILLVFVFTASIFTFSASAEEISTSASSAILYCVNNDSVLYGSNENSKMKIASTTKIMTTLLTLEKAKENNKIVTFEKSMIEEGSSMYLKVGEKVTLKDLCVGMMLPSGNDAATASAISIAGSKEKFVALMNKRAKEIGMKNTNFVTPSGLDDSEHYSTAKDMALLMRECLKNKEFVEISGSKSKIVSFVSPSDKTVTYNNHNRLLSIYPNCIAGKTGYTMAAGRCLVTAARKDGVTLIAVTLNDKNDWQDHTSLFEYGFSKVISKTFHKKTIKQKIVGSNKDSVKLTVREKNFVLSSKSDKITEKIYVPPFAYAPIKKGDKAGEVVYYKNGNIIDRESVKYNENIDYKSTKKNFWDYIKELFYG